MEQHVPALLAAIVPGLLSVLLLGAVWIDIKSRRIPNELVFIGAGLGLLLNSVPSEGVDYISALPGALGFWQAISGFGLGLAIMLPLHVLRAMGAGDVKLMAMVGAFLGPRATVGAILLTFIAGGLLGLTVALRNGTIRRLTENLHAMLLNGFFKMQLKQAPVLDAMPVCAGKMPYAVAIAVGAFSCIAIMRSGHSDFFKYF
jgi:prepilin peptidase CpaA